MKNTFYFLSFIKLSLIVFCSWGILTPLYSQSVKVVSNTNKTISNSSQSFKINTPSENFLKASTDSSEILKDIKVARNPEQVVITNDNKYAFVQCFLSDTVQLVDIAKDEVIKSFRIPSPAYLSLSNDGKMLFVVSMTGVYQNTTSTTDNCTNPGGSHSSSSVSYLTIIDVSTQEIEQTLTIQPGGLYREILNSSNNDTIYLATDSQIFGVDIKSKTATRTWDFGEQLGSVAIDNKIKKIFCTSQFNDTLRAINLSNGDVQSVPLNSVNHFYYIAVDTLSNRLFVAGMPFGGNVSTEVLVFNTITLSQYQSIKFDWFLGSIVELPNLNKLFFSGFDSKTLELNYSTLDTIKTLQNSYNWTSMLYNNKNNKLYTFQVGAQGAMTSSSVAYYQDLIEYNIYTGELNQYKTTESKYSCYFGRTLAISPDGNYVIITNSPENTISILYLNPNTLSVNQEEVSNGDINVYPNPTTNVLRILIKIKFNSDFKVELYNNLGTLLRTWVKKESETNFNINLGNFPKGIYMLRIYSADKYFQTKVIKI